MEAATSRDLAVLVVTREKIGDGCVRKIVVRVDFFVPDSGWFIFLVRCFSCTVRT